MFVLVGSLKFGHLPFLFFDKVQGHLKALAGELQHFLEALIRERPCVVMPAEDVDKLPLPLKLQGQSRHAPVIQNLPDFRVVVARGAHDKRDWIIPGDESRETQNQLEGESGGAILNGLENRLVPQVQGLAHFRQG